MSEKWNCGLFNYWAETYCLNESDAIRLLKHLHESHKMTLVTPPPSNLELCPQNARENPITNSSDLYGHPSTVTRVKLIPCRVGSMPASSDKMTLLKPTPSSVSLYRHVRRFLNKISLVNLPSKSCRYYWIQTLKMHLRHYMLYQRFFKTISNLSYPIVSDWRNQEIKS